MSIGLRLLQAVAEAPLAKRFFKRAHIDVKCGACSGFPTCCIAFLSFVWGPSFMKWGTRMVAGKPLQKPERDRPFLMRWYQQQHPRSERWGYVPCPLCILRKHKVKARTCEAGCACGLGDLRAARTRSQTCPSQPAIK
jgi:hypothetical protein